MSTGKMPFWSLEKKNFDGDEKNLCYHNIWHSEKEPHMCCGCCLTPEHKRFYCPLLHKFFDTEEEKIQALMIWNNQEVDEFSCENIYNEAMKNFWNLKQKNGKKITNSEFRTIMDSVILYSTQFHYTQ